MIESAATRIDVRRVNPTFLRPSKNNPRTRPDNPALHELVQSIRREGILQMPVVRIVEDWYEIVCGHRRVQAAAIVGLTEIEVQVVEMTDDQALAAGIAENLARAQMHPLDEAQAIERLFEIFETSRAVADHIGKSERWVARRRMLLNLSTPLVGSLMNREFAVEWYEVVAAETEEVQADALEQARSSWGPKTAAQIRLYLKKRAVSLEDAHWDLADATLPGGACVHCPHCTLSQPLLIDEGEEDKGSCRNRACFEEKFAETARRFAESRGLPLITKAQDNDFYIYAETEERGDASYAVIDWQSWQNRKSCGRSLIVKVKDRVPTVSSPSPQSIRDQRLEQLRKRLKAPAFRVRGWDDTAPYFDGETLRNGEGEVIDIAAIVKEITEKMVPGQTFELKFEAQKKFRPGMEPEIELDEEGGESE
ncbi:MAG: ParB/RepB/Spo0J family partition protein [Bryobacteraceae bacterium]